MKNIVRYVSMVLLIVTISSVAAPAFAAGWEERYGIADLKYGISNNKLYVKNLQADLNYIQDSGLTIDGVYGYSTREAVKEFQRNYGLTIDGIVGDATKRALWSITQ